MRGHWSLANIISALTLVVTFLSLFVFGIPSWIDLYDRKRDEAILPHHITSGASLAIRTSDTNDTKHVYANPDNCTDVAAWNKPVDVWEVFHIIAADNPDDHAHVIHYGDAVRLRASNAIHLSADENRARHLTTCYSDEDEWQTFTLKPGAHGNIGEEGEPFEYGQTFGLQAYNDLYVSHDRDDNDTMKAIMPHLQEWETFTAIKPDNR
jgi:hypothetical protein